MICAALAFSRVLLSAEILGTLRIARPKLRNEGRGGRTERRILL